MPDVILKEQTDKTETLGLIARSLEKIAMLWQIPNWTPGNSVLLAEWIFDNYGYEPLELILNCLAKPPIDQDKIYRLTPDVITKWMSVALEEQAAKREKENLKLKMNFNDPLEQVDYESFKKRIEEGTALKDSKPKHWADDEEYKRFKAERMKQQLKPKE